MSPTVLPAGTVGVVYSVQLTAAGGSGTGYVFTSGPLPDGLTLSPSGLLSGTPTIASSSGFTIVVSVTDSDENNGNADYVLTVKSASQAGNITSSAPQTYYGQNVVLTATFSATANGSAPMTGTVAFYDGETYLGTAPLVANGPLALAAVPALTVRRPIVPHGVGPVELADSGSLWVITSSPPFIPATPTIRLPLPRRPSRSR